MRENAAIAGLAGDRIPFALVARLGAALAPARDADALLPGLEAEAAGHVPGKALAAMLADPVFGPHLAALGRRRAGPPPCPEGLVERLARRAETRLAAFLVTSTRDELARVATLVAAAVMQRRFLAAVTRTQREALAAAFGPEARALGTGEAPVLYAALAELDDGSPLATAEAAQRAGLRVLARFLHQLEPGLSAAFARRTGTDPSPGAGVFTPRHAALVERLVVRSVPAWQPRSS